MRVFSLVVLGLALLLVSLSSDADAAQKKKKKKTGHTHGVITNIERGNGDAGSITIQTRAKKGVAGKQLKIDIAADTKIEKTKGKKQQRTTVASNFSELLQGQHVDVHLRSGSTSLADRITIGKHHKKKKKTT